MNASKILVVDDDKELCNLIKAVLNKAGFNNVFIAIDSKTALDFLQKDKIDLILLDIMMPYIDGIELLKTIRENSNVPVIMLTAKGEIEDKAQSYEAGADDYIVKPFLMKELILRIKAVLKRAYPNLNKRIQLKNCMVDLNTATVIKDNKSIKLTAKEFKLLEKLYENAGNIVSIPSLCQHVVGEIFTGYENTLMSHIRHLREKIEDDPSKPKNLITVKGLGYRLITRN